MTRHTVRLAIVALATVMGAEVVAQTVIKPPKNKYSTQQDVKLGREAAAEVEQQLPILRDETVTSYVQRLGDRLENALPRDLQYPEFRYTFKVVNVKEINAFALPGGPMYFNRGMLEAAKSEGEIAGVLAHEMGHVALRHGTAQQSKAAPYQAGQIGGAILGAIIGGRTGQAIAGVTQFGFGTAFLRFSREYEKQADLLGAQMLARAGYDPREMANMFRTIEQQGGAGVPEFMSNHPNPGNRAEYITREAQMLRVEGGRGDSSGFRDVQARLGGMSPAPTTEQAAKNAGAGRAPAERPDGRRVEGPSSKWVTYNEGNLFRIAVPSNWRELPSSNSVTFAPQGAYGTVNQQSVFTHGVQAGLAGSRSRDLQSATDELLQALAQSNPRMGRPSGYQRARLGGRDALVTGVRNVSDATGSEEIIVVYTTFLPDNSVFYVVGVSPSDVAREYQPVFQRVAGSIQFR